MTKNDRTVLCIGELVWDLFPDGARIGGAPFNVAVHLAREGAPVTLLTAVGHDELGARSLAFLQQEGIPGAWIHPRLPTGTVKIELDPEGIPRFLIHGYSAWTDLGGARMAGASSLAEALDPFMLSVIVFGGLAMHSSANRDLAADLFGGDLHRPGDPPVRVCDLNLRPGWSDPDVVRWCAQKADILKVNQEELHALKDLASDPTISRDQDLLSRYSLQGLCITLGPDGLRWIDARGGEIALPPWSGDGAPPLVDTVGAGDTITASIALGLLRQEPAEVFLERGRRWSARICGTRGALPPRREA